jgi:hypothetical protein
MVTITVNNLMIGGSMALIADPVYTITYSFLDVTGSKATTQAYVRQGLLIADVIARAQALALALNACSNGALTGYTISRSWKEDQTPSPAATSRVERKGRTIWLADQYESRIDIPSLEPAIINTDGSINRSSVQFLALGAVLLTDFVGDFTDSRGVSLDGVKAAYEAFTRSTKRRLPTRRLA